MIPPNPTLANLCISKYSNHHGNHPRSYKTNVVTIRQHVSLIKQSLVDTVHSCSREEINNLLSAHNLLIKSCTCNILVHQIRSCSHVHVRLIKRKTLSHCHQTLSSLVYDEIRAQPKAGSKQASAAEHLHPQCDDKIRNSSSVTGPY